MKTIVFSCKYPQLMPYFAKQFNKYFSDTQEAIVLTLREILGLPDNFSCYELPSYSRSWCNDIMPFFEDFKDEYFLSCMEDHFLYQPVDDETIDDAIELMEMNCIDKMGFQIGVRSGYEVFDTDMDIGYYTDYCKMTPRCNYASSLQPSIWRTSFFKTILNSSKNKTAWEFETKNKHVSLVEDYMCIYRESPEPYPVADIVRNGHDNTGFWEPLLIDEDDKVTFSEARDKIFS